MGSGPSTAVAVYSRLQRPTDKTEPANKIACHIEEMSHNHISVQGMAKKTR